MPIELLGNMQGAALDLLIENDMDIGVLRPWKGADGRGYVTKMVKNAKGVMEPKVFATNAPALLPRDSWIAMDTTVIRALTEELRLVSDIRARGLEFNLPNGMAHTMLQYQTAGDITPATVSMDPIRRGEADRPTTDYANLPLPIVHKDFDFSAREILSSRQGNLPIDTTTTELAARQIAVELEKMAAGSILPFSYGGANVYGLVNHPSRSTKTDMPTPDGTNGPAVITAILALRQLLINNRFKGPYVVYVNTQWSQFLDSDFSATKGDQTLRQRIMSLDGIEDIRTLDTLGTTKWDFVIVQMTSATVRMVIGMEVQVVTWESLGGLMKHFKLMCLIVPQVRASTAGTVGIAHGTNAP